MNDEVIDTSEFQFKGKHAEYVNKLTSIIDTRSNFSIFNYNVDVLIIAPIVGKLYGRKAKVDNDNSIKPIKINFQQLTSRSSFLDYNKELILLLSKKDSTDIQERIDKAFRYIYDNKEENKEKRKECEEEYLEYILGGVEVLYEKIMQDARTIDDYIDNMYEFINDVQSIIGTEEMTEDELFNLCMKAENSQK